MTLQRDADTGALLRFSSTYDAPGALMGECCCLVVPCVQCGSWEGQGGAVVTTLDFCPFASCEADGPYACVAFEDINDYCTWTWRNTEPPYPEEPWQFELYVRYHKAPATWSMWIKETTIPKLCFQNLDMPAWKIECLENGRLWGGDVIQPTDDCIGCTAQTTLGW